MYSPARFLFRALFRAAVFCMLSFFCAYAHEHAQEDEDPGILLFNPDVQKELVIIDSSHADNLNPHTANYSSEAQILNGLYEGLFSYDPMTLDPLPALAETFRISRDQKTWTFTLRENAQFSNGESIEAEDVKRSWLALLRPGLRAPFASLLDCIAGAAAYRNGTGSVESVGITAKNKKTLVVRLEKPAKHFAKILCHHAFAVVHPDANVFSGAFMLKKHGKEETVLEKNPFYYAAGEVALPSIRIITGTDKDENAFSFNTGKSPWVEGVINVEKIYDKKNVAVYPEFGTEFFFFKASNSPWNNLRMRKAVLAAIPWEKLRQDAPVAAQTLIVPLQNYPKIYGVGDDNGEDAEDSEDSELFAQAASNSGKKRGAKAGGKKPIPTLTIAIPDFDYTKKQAALIADSLKEAGIKVLVKPIAQERYLESIGESKADLFTYTWIGDFADPLSFLELFRKDSSLRITDWRDEGFEALLEQAASAQDEKERYKKLAEAEQFLLDETLILPVSHPVSLNAVDTDVLGGWFVNALDIHPFKYLYFLEPVKIEGII